MGLSTDAVVLCTRINLYPVGQSAPIPIQVCGLQRLEIVTPSTVLDQRLIGLFQGLRLADPNFITPRGIDLVLGADAYSRFILPGVNCKEGLVAQQTVAGWTITGETASSTSAPAVVSCSTTFATEQEPWHEVLIGLLRRFWSVEEVPTAIRQSPDDVRCESIYVTRHTRDRDGRYCVPLPMRPESLNLLGDGLDNARRALSATHRRMGRDPHLRDEYVKFMREYLEMGHMRLLTSEELEDLNGQVHYLPHHGIWQRKDGGQKLRVVFNASSQTSSGASLNDVLIPGRKLQSDLWIVITRWRRWLVAFCADIKMMFRQIRISLGDEHFQRIIWSISESDPVLHFVLLTVTYGTSSAPYLSLRTLKQLCEDEGEQFPEAVLAVEEELYVDDFLSGAHTVLKARQRRDQLIGLLRRGGFELKKWVSNSPELLKDLPSEDCLRPTWMQFASEGPVNELGVAWDPFADQIRFIPPMLGEALPPTKRRVLSGIAQLFDPAGWLAPITVSAKMLMQDLWKDKLDWDESLPLPLARRWESFKENLQRISDLSLPRWLGWSPTCRVQLHAFADASRRAIAAVVYLRTEEEQGPVQISLIAAKTKLASIKSQISSDRPCARMTIPRLELRAALLAARLLSLVAKGLGINQHDCHSWSDSQITLHWLRSEGPVGNDFVDNYVSHIQEILPGCAWSYVNTTENPADLATRGTDPQTLGSRPIWWQGPSWLSDHPSTWPVQAPTKSIRITALTTKVIYPDVMDRFSCLNRLLRALARCRRLWTRRKDKTIPAPLSPVTVAELHHVFIACVRLSQRCQYALEIEDIAQGRPVCTSSSLKTLAPFLDDAGILRVGGRLDHSDLPYDEKHPVILDGKSRLGQLIIDWAHQRALHGGYRLTHSFVMKRAWLIGGRTCIKSRLRKCMVCAKDLARTSTQIMAPLPAARVTVSPPFSKCGVDYAGPFQVLRSKGRGLHTFKGYVAVFVCLNTKAVHLELAGDLSTASFLGALNRFIGRRGCPTEIWSDNGTNFKGADAELRRLMHEAQLDWGSVDDSLAIKGISWRFIPPAAPHFGGLWEAGVKSMKSHLRRVTGPRRLTYEEFATLLVEIEAVLNSRPLGSLSGSLDDLDALTPAHFLLGRSAASFPRPSSLDVDLSHRAHWELVQGMRDSFWSRWSREYLHTLQQRLKWNRTRPDFVVGDLVMVIDASLLRPNGNWPLGCVTAVHPGSDGHVRTVDVRTATGVYRRPIAKVAHLPLTAPVSTEVIASSPE